ncbi:MAG TPA: ClpXP protease specificity-enhancing factor [Azonexus sp.]
MELPSTKPYLLRAIWEWCCDNGFTPYVAVQVDNRTSVPREFVRDGQIVLNVGPDATNKLQMGNELIEFQARFGGVARQLSVPVEQVSAIYARENGAGMAFEIEPPGSSAFADAPAVEAGEPAPEEPPPEPTPPEGGRPKLQRIK